MKKRLGSLPAVKLRTSDESLGGVVKYDVDEVRDGIGRRGR